jgi:O-antigen ligase
LLFLMFCLVETQSRAPLATMGVCIVIFIFGPIGGISRWKRFAAVGAAIAVFAVIMPGFFTHAVGRFDTLDAEKSEEEVSRASMWIYTRGIIAEHPLLGIGFGEKQFINAMHETDFQQHFGRDTLDNPHNSYLQSAVYAGIPCIALFVLANLALLMRAARIVWNGQKSAHPPTETFGLAVGILGFLLSMYPDMHLYTANLAPLYWMFAGLLLAFTTRAPIAVEGELPAIRTAATPSTWLTPAWRKPRARPSPDIATTDPGRASSKSSY